MNETHTAEIAALADIIRTQIGAQGSFPGLSVERTEEILLMVLRAGITLRAHRRTWTIALSPADLELAHASGGQSREEWEAARAVKPPPVDRSQRELVSGMTEAESPDYRELKENGQQKDYVILSAEERAKGFVRPVRRSYIHERCCTLTTMGQAIAETYARDPSFYSETFCVGCGAHFPVGDAGEFVWDDGSGQKVGT